jgi:hypothetical protein
MFKYLSISSYIRKPFLIYDFAPVPIWISLYMLKNLFYFLSVYTVHGRYNNPMPELLYPPVRDLWISNLGFSDFYHFLHGLNKRDLIHKAVRALGQDCMIVRPDFILGVFSYCAECSWRTLITLKSSDIYRYVILRVPVDRTEWEKKFLWYCLFQSFKKYRQDR